MSTWYIVSKMLSLYEVSQLITSKHNVSSSKVRVKANQYPQKMQSRLDTK